MLALTKHEHLSLTTTNKAFVLMTGYKSFDQKVAMLTFLPYFRNENKDCDKSCLPSLII